MNTTRSLKQSEHGATLVEFAFVAIFLVFLMMGVFDLGRGVYAYNVIASAAREGARYGIAAPTNTTAIRTRALANTEGLDKSQLTVTITCSTACTQDNRLTVTVTYLFKPVTAFFANLTLTSNSTMTIE